MITQPQEIDELKLRLKATWNAGDYDVFSRYMETGARSFFDRLKVAPGASFLDVGCGSGQLGLMAARAGALVTGCDISPNWVAKARGRAAAEGLAARFDEGDAEALPYADGQFDVVASLIGAMFAPRPELVAAELARVCRPGGIIAMANWTRAGFIGQMFGLIAKYIAPSGMPSPLLWGDEATVRQRLRPCTTLSLNPRMYRIEYPFPPSEVVEFFRVNYGPMVRAFASLAATAAQEELRAELTALWSAHNQAEGNGTRVDAEYLEVIGQRGPS